MKVRLTKNDSWAEFSTRVGTVHYRDSSDAKMKWTYADPSKANDALLAKVEEAKQLGFTV
jgi:hypothetical protein